MILNSPYISGSLIVTSNGTISGSLTVLGGITGAITGSATSASYAVSASEASKLQGLGSASFAPASTFNTVSQSYAASSASLSTRVTTNETNISTLTAASASFAIVSSSYAAASGSLSTRVTNVETTASVLTSASSSFATMSGSLSTRVTNLEATSSTVSQSFASTSGSISSRVTLIEGQYATTGSNNFTKPQQISDVSNAISFTSTASLYTEGGLRVKGSSFISGTAYFNDVVVYGTSSIEYITSSQIAIGTNLITLNTDTPSVRFGGISVFDSGSNNLSTGSLFWDSEKDKWIYSNPSGSTYDGGMLISGPRNTSGIGNEVGTTSCALMMGQGGDHITSSAIFSYGNATCFYGQSYISSSGNAYFAGCIGVGTSSPLTPLHIHSSLPYIYLTDTSTSGTRPTARIVVGDVGTCQALTIGFSCNDGTTCNNEVFTITELGNIGINTATPQAPLTIKSTGATGVLMSCDTANPAVSSRLFFQSCQNEFTILNSGGTLAFTYAASLPASSGNVGMRMSGDGIVFLSCQLCSPHLIASNNISIGSNCISTDGYNTRLRITNIQNDTFVFAFNNQACKAIMYMYGGNINNPQGYTAWIDNTSGQTNHLISHNSAEATYFAAKGGFVGIGATSPQTYLHVCDSLVAGRDDLIRLQTTISTNHAWMKSISCAGVTSIFGSNRANTDGNLIANHAVAGTTSAHNFDLISNSTVRVRLASGGAVCLLGNSNDYPSLFLAGPTYTMVAMGDRSSSAATDVGYISVFNQGTRVIDLPGNADPLVFNNGGPMIAGRAYASGDAAFGYQFLEVCNGQTYHGPLSLGNSGGGVALTPLYCGGGKRWGFGWNTAEMNNIATYNNCTPILINWGVNGDNPTTDRKFCFNYSGNAYASGGTWGTLSSNCVIKTCIVGANSQWSDVKNICIVNYKMKEEIEEYGDAARIHLGVIAEQVAQVSPGLLEEGGYSEKWCACLNGVKTSILHMKAVKALQEAMCRIEILESCLGMS